MANKRKNKNKNNKKKGKRVNNNTAIGPKSKIEAPKNQIRIRHIKESLVEKVCGQIDPFCPAALGSKINDQLSTFSTTACVRYHLSLTSNASGNAAIYLQSSLYAGNFVAPTLSGTEVTAWNAGTAVPQYSSWSGSLQRWRTVSFGFRIFTTANAMTANGQIYIHTIPNLDASSSPPNITYTNLTSTPDAITMSARNLDHVWIARHTLPFTGPNTYNLAYDPFTTPVVIGYTGVASTTIASIEVIHHLEWWPTLASTAVLTMDRTAPDSNVVQEAVSNTVSGLKSVYDAQSAESVIQAAARVAVGAAQIRRVWRGE